MNTFISDGKYGTKKDFPENIQQRIDNGMGCGSSIGKGWLPIIIDLDEKLSKIDPDYKINQIKEKFGGLRFYVSGNLDDDGYRLISEAERQSYKTCEICGKPGKCEEKDSGTWLATRCEEHK